MNKALGSPIHWSMLKEGEIYRIKMRALGEVLARLVNKEKLEFEITEGFLKSQARGKSWHVGDCFPATPGLAEFWEPL